MFPTKQDTGGLCVPLVSFTGRAPYASKHMEIPRKAEKRIPPVEFSTGGTPDFQLYNLCPKAGNRIPSEDRQSLNL